MRTTTHTPPSPTIGIRNPAHTRIRAKALFAVQAAAATATPPGAATTTLATYTYDGDGLRISETTPTAITNYTWDTTSDDLPHLLADNTQSYIYGPDGLPIEQLTTTTSTGYYFHDTNGTTRALLNGAGGIGATYTYNPYGARTALTGNLRTPLQYAQTYTDPATAQLYAIDRTYDPTTTQFTTVDPVVERRFG